MGQCCKPGRQQNQNSEVYIKTLVLSDGGQSLKSQIQEQSIILKSHCISPTKPQGQSEYPQSIPEPDEYTNGFSFSSRDFLSKSRIEEEKGKTIVMESSIQIVKEIFAEQNQELLEQALQSRYATQVKQRQKQFDDLIQEQQKAYHNYMQQQVAKNEIKKKKRDKQQDQKHKHNQQLQQIRREQNPRSAESNKLIVSDRELRKQQYEKRRELGQRIFNYPQVSDNINQAPSPQQVSSSMKSIKDPSNTYSQKQLRKSNFSPQKVQQEMIQYQDRVNPRSLQKHERGSPQHYLTTTLQKPYSRVQNYTSSPSTPSGILKSGKQRSYQSSENSDYSSKRKKVRFIPSTQIFQK